MVAVQQSGRCPAVDLGGELPAQVHRVLETGVEALPGRRADALSDDEQNRLHTALRRTLRSAVRAGRVPPRSSWLTGRRDAPAAACPRCGTALSRKRLAGRGTVWCPSCQPAHTAGNARTDGSDA
ncbi:zinc finger domain-containing protein [Streptomyces tubercidicus]